MALVTIRRYRDLSEAIVARSLLESAGIGVELCDENLVRLDWQISNFIGGIRLRVDSEDERDANEMLDAPIPDSFDFEGESAPYSQPHCPRCGSTDISFEGASRKAALLSLYTLSLPLPLGAKRWVCDACDNRWKESD